MLTVEHAVVMNHNVLSVLKLETTECYLKLCCGLALVQNSLYLYLGTFSLYKCICGRFKLEFC